MLMDRTFIGPLSVWEMDIARLDSFFDNLSFPGYIASCGLQQTTTNRSRSDLVPLRTLQRSTALRMVKMGKSSSLLLAALVRL